jgi:hypothetical protein
MRTQRENVERENESEGVTMREDERMSLSVSESKSVSWVEK